MLVVGAPSYFNSSSEEDFFALRFIFENWKPNAIVAITRTIPIAKRTQAPADACPLLNDIPKKSTLSDGDVGSELSGFIAGMRKS